MCGIYGINSNTTTANILNALERLEYRGYDSCGLVYKYNNKEYIHKVVGNTSRLKQKVPYCSVSAAIGHTRWATHGIVNTVNAHPHTSASKRFYIAHNGVIDNYLELKAKYGFTFISDTDSEIIVHLLDMYSNDFIAIEAVRKVLLELQGSFAVVILDSIDNCLYFMKNKSPLLIGRNSNKTILASDQCVFDENMEITILNDFNYGFIIDNRVEIYFMNEENILNTFKKDNEQKIKKINEYYMLDEMYYEIDMVKDIAEKYKNIDNTNYISLLNSSDEICFIGAGSSYYAGCILRDYYEDKLKKRCHSIIASEFSNFNILYKNTVFILLSQSGETADLCEVIRVLKDNSYKTVLLCNNINSTLGYASDIVFPLFAKGEISVASTKAFTAMVYVGMLLIDKGYCERANEISNSFKDIFSDWDNVMRLPKMLSQAETVFYLGKGTDYHIAQEGSLKLREISYLHAFAFQSGELKHGSIALVDNKTVCIGISTDKTVESLVKSNLEEVKSRGARAVLISNYSSNADYYLKGDILSIILFMQILAYQTAYLLKRNIDQPRHLAKSVTVI